MDDLVAQKKPRERSWGWALGLMPGLVTALLLKLGSWIEHTQLLKSSTPVQVNSLENFLLMVLWGVLTLIPFRHQIWFCAVFLAAHQFLSFLDLCYFHFFDDLPSLYLLPMWFQAGRTTDSVTALLVAKDALVLVPLVLYLPVGGLLWRCRKRTPNSARAGSIVILLGVLMFGYSFRHLHPVRHEQLQRRFQNIALARIFGPLFYHYYDLAEWSRVQLGLEAETEVEDEQILRLINESRALSTEATPFQGLFQGRDFIFLQLEAFQYFALDSEYEGRPIMPFLQEAQNRVFTFKLFDQTHLGRSADGQFIYMNSLHPTASRPLPFTYPTNTYFGLPKMFADKGYRTIYMEPCTPSFWNADKMAENYGFQERLFTADMPPENRARDIRGWGLTDFALFKKARELGMKSSKPFFIYVVTVMCHHPYAESSNTPVDFPPKNRTSMVRRYLRCFGARDQAVKELMLELAKTERGRRTVICLAGDHDANLPDAEMRALGYPTFPEREVVTAMVGTVEDYLGLQKGQAKPKPPHSWGAQMDLAPSLGHVFSLAMEESVFVGWNLFATQNRGPYDCRIGTHMDQSGKIHDSERSGDRSVPDQFRVSEMLLQADKIEEFRSRK